MSDHIKKEADEFHRAFGLRMRTARQAQGISQMEASEELGNSFQQIQKNEHGKNRFHAWAIYRLKHKYGVSYDYLFGETDSMDGITPAAEGNSKELLFAARLVQKLLAIEDETIRGSIIGLIDQLTKSQGDTSGV